MGKGAALLAAGHGLGNATAGLTTLVSQIGEALLSIGWTAHRLAPIAGERHGADRTSWKACVSELAAAPVETIVLAVAGRIAMFEDQPCLVTGTELARYPEDSTLPLTWIRDHLRESVADRVVIVASFDGEGNDREWLDELATGRDHHLVAVERANGAALSLHAFLDGLRGEALDPTTGTVTLRSLGQQLRRRAPDTRLRASEESLTLASVPQLAGPWDARLTSRRAAPIPQETEDLVGTVLPGRFKIESAIARGSFGNVYVAHQLSIDRFVAVKVLHGAVAASEAGRLFVQEIQAVGRLDHPNIVKIYQADMTASGSLFYAMELLAGRDLQQIVEKDGVLEKDRAIALVRQLASALGAAHEVGLVHADVKPANTIVVEGKGGERLVLLDFGLARLRGDDASAGGTPAYMAPEQLNDHRVDARSDVFAAGLVLVTLLTGWRRRSQDQMVPPLDDIDAKLRPIVAKALALAPADRYQNGTELAQALGEERREATVVSAPPFRHLASFTEEDRDRLYGRDKEIAALAETVVFRGSVVYTAPTGTGKTSLLRAGLFPRLDALGMTPVYIACHRRDRPDFAGMIEAAREPGKRVVVIVDQIEAVLADDTAVEELRALVRDPSLGSVLSVREDVLATLLSRLDVRSDVLRLGPLAPDGARAAIVGPLIERRIAIEDKLLDVLLADLERAAALIAPEMRWLGGAAIYPPHLQLACSALYERLAPGEENLELRHYEALGGLDEIVREYLDRVVETEIPGEMVTVAKRVLGALVDNDRSRTVRTESELGEYVPGVDLAPVLEALRARGVIVPLRAASGQAAWELVHDSLVPRVLAWSDREALERQRALEIVRHHLRRSTDAKPSLLSGDELHEVAPHGEAVVALDAEWQKRGPAKWTPITIVGHSRKVRRNRWIAIVSSSIVLLAVGATLLLRYFDERDRRRREELMSAADLGSFTLELHPFDWDPKAQSAIEVSPRELPQLDWKLYDPSPDEQFLPSSAPLSIERSVESPASTSARWSVTVRGGPAILVVENRARAGETCAPSIIPLARLPGRAKARAGTVVSVQVPTCQATLADSIMIPAGAFHSDARGEPPITIPADMDVPAPTTVDLPAFRIDRVEVSNGAYRQLASPLSGTLVTLPTYLTNVPAYEFAASPRVPVTFVSQHAARTYCRFMGKDLPTDQEWQKADRGGLVIDGGPNPHPDRVLPWGTADLDRAHVAGTGRQGSHEVDADPGDVSPYGVLDLAGNVMEWTRSASKDGAIARGGCWEDWCPPSSLSTFMAIQNARAANLTVGSLGFRCVDEAVGR